MVKTKFKTDELKNVNEYVIECLKATLKSYPSDNEYLVDISFETADGIYFHTEVDFVLGTCRISMVRYSFSKISLLFAKYRSIS